jgi:hypothetical protein
MDEVKEGVTIATWGKGHEVDPVVDRAFGAWHYVEGLIMHQMLLRDNFTSLVDGELVGEPNRGNDGAW